MLNTRLAAVLATCALTAVACSGGTEEAAGDADTSGEAVSLEVGEVMTTPVAEISAEHVDPPVTFSTAPATGGDHFAFWMNCGFYSEPVIEGGAAHSLEHGAVWITYGDSLPDEEVAALEELAESNNRLLISPYDHPEPIVLSAWGAQQRGISSTSAPEVDAFIEAWQDNPELIEAGAPCIDAVGIPPDRPNLIVNGTPVPEEFLS